MTDVRAFPDIPSEARDVLGPRVAHLTGLLQSGTLTGIDTIQVAVKLRKAKLELLNV